MENEIRKTDPTGSAGTVNKDKNRSYINVIVGVGIMTAIVVVLQLLSTVIKFGTFSITLALTAIIVGGAVYGIWAGAWLGFVMAAVILLFPEPGTVFFMGVSFFGTVVTVIAKSTLAGLLSGLVYKLLEKKGRYISVVTAGVVTPVVNTGIFLLGCFIFFMDTIYQLAGDNPVGEYIVTGLIGLNFPIELAVNLALSTVTVTIIGIAKKSMAQR